MWFRDEGKYVGIQMGIRVWDVRNTNELSQIERKWQLVDRPFKSDPRTFSL